MRRPGLRFRVRHLMIGVAVAAVGLFALRATWGGAEEVIIRPWAGDGTAVRVRLDAGRLRAHGLSRDDVIRALTPSSMSGSPRRPHPPPGVVFVTRLRTYGPGQYEKIVLKATAEGEILRLGDIGKVEVVR